MLRLEAEFESILGSDPDLQSEAGIERLARIPAHMPPVRWKDAEQTIRDPQRHRTAHQPRTGEHVERAAAWQIAARFRIVITLLFQ